MRLPVTDTEIGMNSELKRLIAKSQGDGFTGWYSPAQVQKLLQQTGVSMRQLMLELVRYACEYAYVPISDFTVGAVSLGDSGALYFGCNLEFAGAALSFCTHAEQSAITHAKFHGETGVSALAISAAPCGFCRQFLYELRVGKDLAVFLQDQQTTLGSLLPDPFGPGELGNKCRLLDRQDHRLSLTKPTSDTVILSALDAANTCYAPYTQGYAGVALVDSSGRVFNGGCKENVAYNPSLSPMEAALVPYTFAGSSMSHLARAVLVECIPSKCSQVSASRAVLASISPEVELEVYQANSAETPDCLETNE